MDDSSINKELKQKLNFSYCEEESESEGQEAWETRDAHSQIPDRAEGQESEAKFTPPGPPLSSVHEVGTFQEKTKKSPEQVLMTPVSGFRNYPETPAQPDSRSKLLDCESPFTPKVSKLWGKGTQVAKICVPSAQRMESRTRLCMCIWPICLTGCGSPQLHIFWWKWRRVYSYQKTELNALLAVFSKPLMSATIRCRPQINLGGEKKFLKNNKTRKNIEI